MQISQLLLKTADLAAQHAFYADTLGMEVLEYDSMTLELQVGASILVFEQEDDFEGKYHFAFNVPRNQFAEAKTWLAARVPLVTFDGSDQFHSDTWNADYCYYYDAAGNIGEFIARHTLTNDSHLTFSVSSLQRVSEIGIGCEDVANMALWLTEKHGIPPYHSEPNAQFMSMGDEEGLFILVNPARIWYPNTGIVAGQPPVEVVLESGISLSLP